MVSGSVLGGIIGFIGTAFTGFVLAGLWVWRHRTNLDTNDHDRISELKDEQRSQFDSKLADLFLTIDEAVDDSTPPEEMERSEIVVNAVRRGVNEDDVQDVVDALEEIGDRQDLYEQHEDYLVDCYQSLFKAGGGMFFLGVAFVFTVATQADPFSGPSIVIYTAIFGFILSQAANSYRDFRDANNCKDEFEKAWREYKSPD